MRFKAVLRFLFPLMLAAVISGCATVPYTGRSQFLITSEQEEINLGNQAWKQLKSEQKASTNKFYISALNRIGKNIAKAADKKDYRWEFMVFDSKEPNAFCLPGGKIGVYTGLFEITDNDAELAAVVGHEVGHAIARHGGERISQNFLQSLGGQILSNAVADQRWMTAYGAAAQVGAILPYSRLHEYEADYMGLMLMAKAGYNPDASITFWDKFRKYSNVGVIGEFFSTHPMSEKRLGEMKKELPKAVSLYRKAPVKYNLGEIYLK